MANWVQVGCPQPKGLELEPVQSPCPRVPGSSFCRKCMGSFCMLRVQSPGSWAGFRDLGIFLSFPPSCRGGTLALRAVALQATQFSPFRWLWEVRPGIHYSQLRVHSASVHRCINDIYHYYLNCPGDQKFSMWNWTHPFIHTFISVYL